MKDGFRENIGQRTDGELETISKDSAFYSEEERYIALAELEMRGPLPEDLAAAKKLMRRYPSMPDSVSISRIYGNRYMIFFGSMLGGPLAAGYMIAENFKAFGEPERARRTWIYSIAVTITVFGTIFILPDEITDRVPNLLIPLIYSGIASALANKFQNMKIETHLFAGGRSFSWWRAAVVGLIGLAISIAAVFAVAILTALNS